MHVLVRLLSKGAADHESLWVLGNARSHRGHRAPRRAAADTARV